MNEYVLREAQKTTLHLPMVIIFRNGMAEHSLIGQYIKGTPVIGRQKQTSFCSVKYPKWIFSGTCSGAGMHCLLDVL